jgi:glycosyltransferase involved in cell wall biosynthesis
MKFSVLLPTRNRLDLLSYAIETVRRQDYSDWEIIVSDNFSEEDIGGYVKSLNDSRIKYYRTDKFVPVTDNWNNALYKSDGDYVIMLGDDDCLMQGYFSELYKLIKTYNAPDFIYTGAYQFAYPGVLPWAREGYLRSAGFAKFFQNADTPFFLDNSEAKEMVKYSLNFKIMFDYNAQFSLVSRDFIKSLEKYGKFYQSPYPDYYSSNVLMLKAKRILVTPKRLVTVGISPKSFGFYYFNDLENEGSNFLKNLPDAEMAKRLENVIIPGTDMYSSTLLAMETILVNFGSEAKLKVNYERYRLIQMFFIYTNCMRKKRGAELERTKLWLKLKYLEKIFCGLILSPVGVVSKIFPERFQIYLANKMMSSLRLIASGFKPENVSGNFVTILDVFDRIESSNHTKSDS